MMAHHWWDILNQHTLDARIQSNSRRFSWKTFPVESNIYWPRFQNFGRSEYGRSMVPWVADQWELKTSLRVTVTIPFTTYSKFQIFSRADPSNKLSLFFGRRSVPRKALKTWPDRTPVFGIDGPPFLGHSSVAIYRKQTNWVDWFVDPCLWQREYHKRKLYHMKSLHQIVLQMLGRVLQIEAYLLTISKILSTFC